VNNLGKKLDKINENISIEMDEQKSQFEEIKRKKLESQNSLGKST
jgi:hypothetical protein